MINFQCQRCGACCKIVGELIPHLPLPIAATLSPLPNGWCKNLQENDNGTFGCKIYEHRPLICRVNWVTKRQMRAANIDEDTMLQMTYDACKMLRQKFKDKENDTISKT